MSIIAHGGKVFQVPTRVPAGKTHAEYLLDEALKALEEQRPDVAITHLAQCVSVARNDLLPDAELDAKVKRIIGAGGGLA